MKIIGILLILSGIGIGITEKEYGIMVFGIVLGAFLIWYSPKHKEKALVRKEERKQKAYKKMIENMSEEEFKKYVNTLDEAEKSLDEISDNLNQVGDEIIEIIKEKDQS